MEIKQSPDLAAALSEAFAFARAHQHEYVGVDHFFWGIIQQPEAVHALRSFDVDVSQLKRELRSFLESSIKAVPEEIYEEFHNSEPELSIGCQEILMISAQHALTSQNVEISCVNIMIAMFRLEDSFSLELLRAQDISRFKRLIS